MPTLHSSIIKIFLILSIMAYFVILQIAGAVNCFNF